MKPIDDKQDTVTIRAVNHDEEGRKRIEKVELHTHNIDTVKYVERKLIEKGVQRMDRHPADGRIGIAKHGPPKSGHGGKYTWEGPAEMAENELSPTPPAMDEGDPNYVEEEVDVGDAAGLVVGEVEVAKVADQGRKGVARIDVDPQLNAT